LILDRVPQVNLTIICVLSSYVYVRSELGQAAAFTRYLWPPAAVGPGPGTPRSGR